MKITGISGGITAPAGYSAAGVHAGIKKEGSDMAAVLSAYDCTAAGVFTRNVVKAAPVLYDRALLDEGKIIRGVIVNSGNANACTAEEGMEDCRRMAEAAEQAFGAEPGTFLVASTGVIGQRLPMDAVLAGAKKLAPCLTAEEEGGHEAARAIMTTDTRPKECAVSYEYEGKTVTVGGMCKGSGMIHPNMGTMLCFIATDAAVTQPMLAEALRAGVTDTFNMVSVDGDTSTNDTVLVLANGASGTPLITEKDGVWELFAEALRTVMEDLCRKIAGDGEGCTCLFEVKVKGCRTKEDARTLAKSVVSSSLTKAAVYGHDANWGRILCALGYAGVEFDPQKVDLYFESEAGSLCIARDGAGSGYSEEEATKILSAPEVTALCVLHEGEEEAAAWGCDLTHEYVSINADYRS